ncbi:hypothetical protein HBI84_181070 [Parastagonospora nodorum]|nr:hypothetical protein HBI84_181070 [Parastagonospora nodorum]
MSTTIYEVHPNPTHNDHTWHNNMRYPNTLLRILQPRNNDPALLYYYTLAFCCDVMIRYT